MTHERTLAQGRLLLSIAQLIARQSKSAGRIAPLGLSIHLVSLRPLKRRARICIINLEHDFARRKAAALNKCLTHFNDRAANSRTNLKRPQALHLAISRNHGRQRFCDNPLSIYRKDPLARWRHTRLLAHTVLNSTAHQDRPIGQKPERHGKDK